MAGTGTVAGVPDVLVLDAGVAVRSEDPAAAFSDAKEALARLRAAALAAGLAAGDLATTQVSLNAVYNREGEPDGYEAALGLAVTVRQVDTAGAVIDAVASAAGEHARLGGVRLEHSDPSHLIRQARAAAVADARVKAVQLAGLVDRSLGRCVAVSEGTQAGPRPVMLRAEMAMTDMPIDPGEVAVNVSVTTRWELGD